MSSVSAIKSLELNERTVLLRTSLLPKLFLLMAGTFMLSACGISKSGEGQVMNPTVYYKPAIRKFETSCSSSEMRDLIALDGKILTKLCSKDYDNCLMQGSCYVDDGQSIIAYNYHSMKADTPRFVVIDVDKCPFGYGVRNFCLDPFFSIAADLNFYSVGDVLFVPRLVGAELPTGEVHDGYVIVRDTGGAIKGEKRFDFFTGFLDHKKKENTLARLGFSDAKNKFEFRRATEEETKRVLAARNYPGILDQVKAHGRDPFHH